jgi:hypothetical protein
VRQRFTRFVNPLRLPLLLTALVIAAMTSVPVDSHAGAGSCQNTRIFEYTYYYDAAHTLYAGYCQGACYPGGAWCTGVQTDYYVRSGGDLCGCPGGGDQAAARH